VAWTSIPLNEKTPEHSRRSQKTNEGTKNMRGRKGIGQKEQTQPDLGPAGLVRFANMTIPLTDPCYGENCQARRKIISFY
jgi:hypothetical protein